jgi:hypothetical protein
LQTLALPLGDGTLVQHASNVPKNKKPTGRLAVGGNCFEAELLNLEYQLPLARRHAATARTAAALCSAHLVEKAHPRKNTDSLNYSQINVFAGEKLVFA